MNTSTTDTAEFRTIDWEENLPDGCVNPYFIEDIKRCVSVARVEGKLYAFDDLCTCAQEPCPLSAEPLVGATIMCQRHRSRFDLTNGAVVWGPAREALVMYEVREQAGEIQVRV